MKIPDLDILHPNNQNLFVIKNISETYRTNLLDSNVGGMELWQLYYEMFKD